MVMFYFVSVCFILSRYLSLITLFSFLYRKKNYYFRNVLIIFDRKI